MQMPGVIVVAYLFDLVDLVVYLGRGNFENKSPYLVPPKRVSII